jgi:oligoribonuclease
LFCIALTQWYAKNITSHFLKDYTVKRKSPPGPLVWIDLEMTGLEVDTDVILEIACVITDGELNVVAAGPNFVIQQPKEKLDAMGKWCQDHHGKSGLTDAVLKSITTLEEAEKETLAFIKNHCMPNNGILAGNSIWQDRTFMQRYMPSIPAYLHYRMLDVTTVKELIIRWYPQDKNIEFKKSDGHRALSDVYESIAELEHYRKHFFV